jgi:hypothetical protein
VVRLDPFLPHVHQAVYGDDWFGKVEALIGEFAAAGCGHVICSTGRLTRRPVGRRQKAVGSGTGASQASSFERLEALLAELSPSAAAALRRDYAYDNSGTSAGYLWRRPLRLAFHRRLRAVCEARGMTYATCQENAAAETDSPGIPSCEGYPLPFCVKGMGGVFHPVEGCTALCHVACRGLARPPCGRPELVSVSPLRVSRLR